MDLRERLDLAACLDVFVDLVAFLRVGLRQDTDQRDFDGGTGVAQLRCHLLAMPGEPILQAFEQVPREVPRISIRITMLPDCTQAACEQCAVAFLIDALSPPPIHPA